MSFKLSEVFSGFLKAATDAGIAIEPDAPAAAVSELAPLAVAVSDLQPAAPSAEQEAMQAQLAAQQEELTKAQTRIAAMEQEARTQRFTALAKSWHGETATHLSMLELCAASGGEDGAAFTAYVTQQNAIAEQLKASKLFENIGSSQSSAASATERLNKLATARAKEDNTDFNTALARVAEENPELYEQYRAEASVRVGKA